LFSGWLCGGILGTRMGQRVMTGVKSNGRGLMKRSSHSGCEFKSRHNQPENKVFNSNMKLNKENIPFTMVANEVLYRSDLSMKAKGLFAYLFSKPNGWEFAANRIAKESSEGRKGILSMLQELEDAGLLHRKRLSNGKMQYKLEYTESQSPHQGLRVRKPKSPSPSVALGLSAQRGLVSNTDTEVIRYNNKKDESVGKTVDELWTNMITPYIGPTAPITIKEFELHWRAKNAGDTTERWQMEKVFDLGSKLEAWKMRDQKWQRDKERKFEVRSLAI